MTVMRGMGLVPPNPLPQANGGWVREPAGAASRASALAAAFLAGYESERTRSAYLRDLSDFAAWCAKHRLDPLQARRPHVALYARELELAGRSPATVARRLSTLAGYYRYG